MLHIHYITCQPFVLFLFLPFLVVGYVILLLVLGRRYGSTVVVDTPFGNRSVGQCWAMFLPPLLDAFIPPRVTIHVHDALESYKSIIPFSLPSHPEESLLCRTSQQPHHVIQTVAITTCTRTAVVSRNSKMILY